MHERLSGVSYSDGTFGPMTAQAVAAAQSGASHCDVTAMPTRDQSPEDFVISQED